MSIGDSVYCLNDLPYQYKGKDQVVKSGHVLIVKQIMGDKYVCERFGKMFVIDREELKITIEYKGLIALCEEAQQQAHALQALFS